MRTSTETAAASSRPEPRTASGCKVSRYTLVSSARFRSKGRREPVGLVWNTYTGKTLEDSVCRDLANRVVPDAAEDLRAALIEAHVLVPQDEDELQGVLRRLRQGSADRSVREFVLMPTAACNMSCSYCGQVHAKGDTGQEHRDRIRRRVMAAVGDPAVAKVTVRWFGGEPLMAFRHVLAMGSEFFAATVAVGKVYESRIVTNGALLTVRGALQLHRQAGVGLFIITVDGPAAVHDARRTTKSGLPTFWRIMSTLGDILRSEGAEHLRLQLRTNVDRHNVDSVKEYLRTCAELGLGDDRVLFELAPVHSWSNDADQESLTPEAYAAREVEFYELMLSLGLNFPPLPSQPKRVTCPAVTRSSEIVSPTGAVFSCTEKPLVPAAERTESLITLAALGDSKLRPAGPYDDWNESLAAGETWCRDCPMLGVCGGCCPKLWRESGPPCPSFKRNWDARLTLTAVKRGLIPVGT
jgi:uncharacterized protein